MEELRSYFIDYARQKSHLLLVEDVDKNIRPFLNHRRTSVHIRTGSRTSFFSARIIGFPACVTSNGYDPSEFLYTDDMPPDLAEKTENAIFPAQQALNKLTEIGPATLFENLRCFMNNAPRFANRFGIEYKPYRRRRPAPSDIVKKLEEIVELHNFYQTFRDLSE
ncbi:MAG: hypothetical protein QW318_07755 [Candidatus Caldarchaeum sp.]